MKRKRTLAEYRQSVRRQMMDDTACISSGNYDLIMYHRQNGTIDELIETTAKKWKAEDDAQGGVDDWEFR